MQIVCRNEIELTRVLLIYTIDIVLVDLVSALKFHHFISFHSLSSIARIQNRRTGRDYELNSQTLQSIILYLNVAREEANNRQLLGNLT